MKTFLWATEQVAANELPNGFRVYEVDGHVIWATKEFAEYLGKLRRRINHFVGDCPLMGNMGDNQDYVMSLCKDTGITKPCYEDCCAGCDEPGDDCANEDGDWLTDDEMAARDATQGDVPNTEGTE